MGIGFSAEERQMIAASLAALRCDMQAATDCFYRHLFARAPETRDLFIIDLERQGAKFAETLGFVVAELDRWGRVRSSVGDLGVRHLAYGVRREHYAAASEAMVAMLRDRLGERFTPPVEASWRRFLDTLCETMIASAYVPDVASASVDD